MASYRVSRRVCYRRPRPFRRSARLLSWRAVLMIGAALLLAGTVQHAAARTSAHGAHGGHRQPVRAAAVVAAIHYAWDQVGKPYCWGGTGPSCYDCSGLMMRAYGWGLSLRTSQEQWAGLPHVTASQAQPGDLVFAPGSDGTWAAPGHVGMLLSRGRVLQAYATGYPIAVTSLRNFAAGAHGIVGFARPAAGGA